MKKIFEGMKNYTVIKKEFLPDINANALILEHDRTKAKIVTIQNDDDNKSFIIGFNTPQKDSTGVPHILEHSVLCGSDKYPVKDSMKEIATGSLNTFMNAFTYPDRTLYPVSSMNDKDFDNLVSVYLDAVFCPRVYKEPRIFMQEGWHYEMDDENDELKINGVVYNEMKGVYSSPDSALSSYSQFSLFPDTQYGVESGGDPACIPELSYEAFTNFHKTLYHPSNSRIFLYGDIDYEKVLGYIDSEYLSKYDKLENVCEIKLQDKFDKSVRVEKEYSISESESNENATFLAYNVVTGDYRDVLASEAISIINYALCNVPGAVLKEKLTKAGIGNEIHSEFTTDIGQHVFSIVAREAQAEDEAKFVQIIEDTLSEIVKNGFDKNTLRAVIANEEFSYREADFGFYPKGIAYGMMTFDTWAYSDENIFADLNKNKVFQTLKDGVDNGLFEKILDECILNNNHKSLVVMKPKANLDKENDEKLREKLAKYKETLSKSEIDEIVKKTKDLHDYQEEPDSEEALATIPTLSISDISPNAKPLNYENVKIGSTDGIYTKQFTNGIAYVNLSFDANGLDDDKYGALYLLGKILERVDTTKHKYAELTNQLLLKFGGLSCNASVFKGIFDTDEYNTQFEISFKALYENIPECIELVREILKESVFDDKKRLHDIVSEVKVGYAAGLSESGHSLANGEALALVSKAQAENEKLCGMNAFRYLEMLTKDFDANVDKLIADLKSCLDYFLVRDNMTFGISCEESAYEDVKQAIGTLLDEFPLTGETHRKKDVEIHSQNVAYKSSSQVQYVTMSGNFVKKGFEYTAKLKVLNSILDNDYLYTGVRLQGGAYGVWMSATRSGDLTLTSYRDPNLSRTLDVYRNMIKYIEEFAESESVVERYIITTIGMIDTPITASLNAIRNYSAYKGKITNEVFERERAQVLSTTVSDIRAMAPMIKAALEDDNYCVVGSGIKIEEEKDLFDKVEPLFG